MGPKYDFPDVDWANEDIKLLVDTFSEKFVQMEKEKDAIITQQSDRIKQLEQEIAQLKSTGRRARKSRSYNTRDLKDVHPQVDRVSGTESMIDMQSHA